MRTITATIENPDNRPFVMQVTIDFMFYPGKTKADDEVDVLCIQDEYGMDVQDRIFSASDKASIIDSCFDAVYEGDQEASTP